MMQWYVIYTKPQSEFSVEALLNQQGIETFLPLIKYQTTSGSKDRKKPLFPCYLFMQIDLEKSASTWQWTTGLRYILMIDGKPAVVPESVISLIKQKLDDYTRKNENKQNSFKPGDTCYITNGPFKGMHSLFEGSELSANRVRVLLEMMGGLRPLDIDIDHIVRVPTSSRRMKRRTRGRHRRIKQYR